MRRLLFHTLTWFAVLLPAVFPSALRAETIPYYRLNLNECFEIAVKNNEEIKAAGYDMENIIAKKIEATKRYVPVTNYKYRIGPAPRDVDNAGTSIANFDMTVFQSFRVETGVPIHTFGRLKLAKTLADLGVDLKELEKQKKADEILLNVYKLYNGILLAREIKDLIGQGLEAVSDKIQELEKEETTDQIEILKLRVVLYEAERRHQEALIKEEIALATMKVLLGLEDSVDFDIKDRVLRQERFALRPFEEFLAQSKSYRPEFKQLQKGVMAKAMQIDLERKEYLPNIGAGGFFEVGYAPGVIGDEDQTNLDNPFNYKRGGLGVEVSGALDFRKILSKVSQAKADHLKTISQKRAAMRGLELDLKKSYLELKQHQFLLSRAEGDKKTARQIVFLTKSNLDIGLGEKRDYLDALQSYLVFQGRAYEAIFNYNSAVATIKVKMGTLFARQKDLFNDDTPFFYGEGE